MKTLRTLAVAMFLSMAAAVVARASDPAAEVSTQLHAFYKFYMHVLNAEGDALKSNRTEMKKYVSARFLKQISKVDDDGGEGDPFILAQDFEKAWEKNILVQKVAIHGEKSTALVTLSGGEMKPDHLNMKLIHDGGTWKIDGVTDADQVFNEVPTGSPAAPAAGR